MATKPEPVTTDPRSWDACARCGAAFACGMKAGAERCWCADVPAIAPDRALAGCLCPSCLGALSASSSSRRSR